MLRPCRTPQISNLDRNRTEQHRASKHQIFRSGATHPRCWRRPAPGRAAPPPREPPPTTSPPPPPPFRLARQAGPTTSPTHGAGGPPLRDGADRSAAPPASPWPPELTSHDLLLLLPPPIPLLSLSHKWRRYLFFFFCPSFFSPRRILRSWRWSSAGCARVYVCICPDSRPRNVLLLLRATDGTIAYARGAR